MKDKKEYIKDLLVRLEDRSLRPNEVLPVGVKYSSDLTIAHEARKEIDKLADEDYISVFQELLKTERVTVNRIHLIRNLIRLADKCERNDIADYVLNLVGKEKTRWINDVALGTLNDSKLKIEKEREILFELANHKDWQIRFNALGLLAKLPASYHNRVEELCLNQVQKYKSKPPSLRTIAAALSKVGTKQSVPILKEIVANSKKSNTILAAINAIHKINGADELDFYIESFHSKRDSFVKKNLIRLICSIGNEDQKELMIKRAKSLLSKKRKTNWVYMKGTEPELVTIIKFLDNYTKEASAKLLKWISQKKLDFLDKTELEWVNERMKMTS